MPANEFGMDLGEVYRTAELVKRSKQRRNMNALVTGWEKEDREASKAHTNALHGARADVALGKPGAKQALVTLDPAEAEKVLAAYDSMDESRRKIMKDNIDAVGRISASILRAENPEAEYMRAKTHLGPEVTAQWPEQYDPNFMKLSLSRARELDAVLKAPSAVTFGDEDILYDNQGQEIGRAKRPVKGRDGAGGTGVDIKSGDEALILKAIVQKNTGLNLDDPDQAALYNKNFSQAFRDGLLEEAALAADSYAEGGKTRLRAAAGPGPGPGPAGDKIRVYNPKTNAFSDG